MFLALLPVLFTEDLTDKFGLIKVANYDLTTFTRHVSSKSIIQSFFITVTGHNKTTKWMLLFHELLKF